ncbi:DUF397 domain-containing protein [Streptomyces collinus]
MNRTLDLSAAVWRKSSYSDGGQTNCLEVSDDHPGTVPVRYSRLSHSPILLFAAGPWASFLAGVKGDRQSPLRSKRRTAVRRSGPTTWTTGSSAEPEPSRRTP